MRTTLNLNEDLFKQASQMTGVQEKTKLIHMGLERIIQAEAAKRLARMFGTVKKARVSPRRKIK